MTIGNIPKEICQKLLHHAQMLIGYIPMTKLKGIKNKAAHHRTVTNLFHFCLQTLLAPIALHGETGLPMMGGDGTWCQCHPILANFIGNYPKQILVTCTYYGECPKCKVPCDQLGSCDRFLSCDHQEVRRTYTLADGDVHTFHAACRDNGIKPIFHPFWKCLPFVNIYISIMLDILHQLLQGVIKHLIAWLSDPLIFRGESINAQCQLMPPNYQIVLFPKGISILSCVSGKEHKNICQLLLGLVVDLQLRDRSSLPRLLWAMCGLLDFLYLAQLPSQTANTIARLECSLLMFHKNKDIFVNLVL